MQRIPRRSALAVLVFGLLASSPALAARNSISGQVLDRNGKPVERAVVTLNPGNVQLVTDAEGRFLIDYLRDESGERTRVQAKVEYDLEVFKAGYHIETVHLTYKRGAILVDAVTLLEDTIEVRDEGENLDPTEFSTQTQAGGATYEGQ
jgi:hypothetical protein